MICIDASRVAASQPDKVLFDDVSLTISRGDRVALVGVNGSGKSTLLRILSGRQEPDAGEIRFGRGVRITVLEQDPVLPAGTVGEFLVASHSGASWEVEAVATSLGVLPLLDRRTDELSGGQAKRVALAAALVGEADVVVLDEPTNHLDLEAIEWLERRLSASTSALLFVTHDRHLMDRLTTSRGAGRVFELDRGEGHVYRAEAGSSAYAASLEGRAERDARTAAEEATRRILARRELAWLRRGAPARSSKPKARLRSATEIVTGGPEGRDIRGAGLDLDLGTTRLGNQVVELRSVARRFGDTTVFEGVDLLVEPGARLGVVGPNGAGKSTLLDIIAGRAEPSDGEVRTGSTVLVGGHA
ncbi:MAG: ABC-F family ATP-binding cassette domain-containing protein, partial [Ilumatobacteraceae bacterium]